MAETIDGIPDDVRARQDRMAPPGFRFGVAVRQSTPSEVKDAIDSSGKKKKKPRKSARQRREDARQRREQANTIVEHYEDLTGKKPSRTEINRRRGRSSRER